jgi:hypothetical protein
MVMTTDGISSYDASTGYKINMDETFVSFFNRNIMFRRPDRNELEITHTFDDIRVKDNYRKEADAILSVKLMRTVRVPDDGKTYNLPQDFGPFPILDTKNFADTLPPGMKQRGGVFYLCYSVKRCTYQFCLAMVPKTFRQRWQIARKGAMMEWILWMRCLLCVFLRDVQMLSGSEPVSKVRTGVQDYIIAPKQSRLYGFRVDDGKSSTVRTVSGRDI